MNVEEKIMWQITPIHVATQHCIRKGMLDRGDPSDAVTRMDIPFICWLLHNDELKLTYLVDCGPDFDNDTNAKLHQPMTMLPEWHIGERLAAMGVSSKSLAGIIATHLHWDHLKAVTNLPNNIPVFVQRHELAYAVASRGKSYGKAYESDEPNPFFLRCYNQYHLLDGDAEIASGLRVTPVPGHTAGSQAVLVETEKGRIVLANDVINVLENWTEGILPGNVADFDAYHRSLETLKKHELEGWRIVPGHDFRVFTTLAPLFDAIYPPQN